MERGHIFVNIFITKECNLRCKHCYHDNFTSEDNLDDYNSLIKELKRLEDSVHIHHINILGGEPLADKDLFFKLEIARRFYTGEINIGTNGTIISDTIIEQLQKLEISLLQISLESHKRSSHDSIRGHGSFDKTITNIKEYIKNNINISLRTTLSKTNKDDVAGIISLAEDLGIRLVSFNRYIPVHSNDFLKALDTEDIKGINKLIQETSSKATIVFENPCNLIANYPEKAEDLVNRNILCGCSVGISSITLDSSGNVYYCTTIDKIIGNISSTSLISIWKDQSIFGKIRRRELGGKCSECKFKMICGGCRSFAYYVNGSLYAEDPVCTIE